jgi:hypothetical protein
MDESMFRSMQAFRGHIREKKLSGVFEFPDGSTEHYLDGKRHREDGPAILAVDGSQLWHQNDALHRTDGPATIDADGDRAWYQHGKLHRDDGPAIEMRNGALTKWFVNGVEVARM